MVGIIKSNSNHISFHEQINFLYIHNKNILLLSNQFIEGHKGS